MSLKGEFSCIASSLHFLSVCPFSAFFFLTCEEGFVTKCGIDPTSHIDVTFFLRS